ncbi:MAG: hypothetical protein GTN64_05685 [Candidatus Latescibacteria bacterium]|nr:hypothetical protein [Candidatus Latescibacterota bacterium]NIO78101.1 hypothetical protein [Candidatus Latescibacterota bacterium]
MVRRHKHDHAIPGMLRAIEVAGGQVPLAAKIGRAQCTVSGWLYRGAPPRDALRIQQVTAVPWTELVFPVETATDGE